MPIDQDLNALADQIRRHFDDGCFACGRENPIGLRVDGFHFETNELVAEFVPRREQRGGPGVMHGGIIATALDEILAWSGMLLERVVVVTGTLEIRYRRPVAIDDTPIRLRGRLDDRHGRKLRLSGSLQSGDEIAAEASGLYVAMHDLAEVLGDYSGP